MFLERPWHRTFPIVTALHHELHRLASQIVPQAGPPLLEGGVTICASAAVLARTPVCVHSSQASSIGLLGTMQARPYVAEPLVRIREETKGYSFTPCSRLTNESGDSSDGSYTMQLLGELYGTDLANSFREHPPLISTAIQSACPSPTRPRMLTRTHMCTFLHCRRGKEARFRQLRPHATRIASGPA